MTKIEPGLYRLSEEVVNPEPDRRYKRDWFWLEKIPAGKVFIIREDNLYKLCPLYDYGHQGIPPHHRLYDIVAAKLVPIPQHPVDHPSIQARIDYELRGREAGPSAHSADAIVFELVVAGKVTIDDVAQARRAYEERD